MARVLYTGYIFFFALPLCIGVYLLSGSPEHVVLGDNVTVTLTCVVDDSRKIVTWRKDTTLVASIRNECKLSINADPTYTYTCDLANKTYYLIIPPYDITDGIENVVWACLPVVGNPSNTWSLALSVPVSTVTITPAGDNNVVDIVEGETQTFKCTTDSSRPAAWIQWYIGGQNVTNQATPQQPQQDGDRFNSSSRLLYKGRDVDHNKVIFCETVNIEGKQKIKSTEKSLYIQLPVTTVTITPAGDNNVVSVIEGETQTFTCTTDSSRPAAWIQWYVGGQNVTNQATPQQDGDKFVSSSSLMYTGRDADHNKAISCQAVNIEGRQKVSSTEKSLYIPVPVTTVTITPSGDNNVVYIIEGETQTFTCTTNYSRPAAWIQWYIGGQNVTNQTTLQLSQEDGENCIASSSLVYTAGDVDHNKSIFCQALNIEGRQKVNSTEKFLYIQYGPKEITLQPDDKSYTVSEMGSINTIICSASCRPDCTFVWKGPNMFEIQQFDLKFESVLRNQSGMYVCNVSNDINSSMSQYISVIVNYKPSDLRLEIHKSNTVNESQSAIFQCNVDSNPASIITWTSTNSRKVLQRDQSVLQSNYTINRANCTQTATYMCQGTNTVNGEMGMANKTIDLYVLCSTRTDYQMDEMPTTIGVKNEEGLNITVFLIAYPKPVIQWVFTNTTINSTHDTSNVFEHVATLYKANMTSTDFGNYTIFAFNEIGETYKKTFIVIPQRTPDPPTNVSASCDILSMIVSWRSEFNGGDLQTFNVLWWKEFENEKAYSNLVLDPGLHKYTDATIPVTADTRYIITVQATNTHGSVTSGEHVSCKTKVLDDTDTPSALIGGVVGSMSGILIIILIVVVVFFIRRHNNKGDDKEPIERNVPHEDDEEDGLKDNPCYITSPGSSNVDSSAHNNGHGYIYSQVDRTNKTDGLKDNPFCITSPGSSKVDSSAHNKGQGYIDSQVDRTNKTGNKEGKGKNFAKTGKMEQKHKDIELDVYENPDEVLNDIQAESVYANSDTNNKMTENDQNKKQKKNKYGLVYADLDLASGPSDSRFVIRGIENRNNYAIIDLTKTAGPLPSDDEDEKHENTVSANRNEP